LALILQSTYHKLICKKGARKLISGIYELIDGALVHQLRVETISNNLANQNTTGFRKDIISFNEALTMNYISETDFSPGPVRYTGNKLDVALEGQGFFKVQTPEGIRFTRDGAFTLNAQGVLVTRNGDAVLGQNGPIQINGSRLTIENNGQVLVDDQPVDKLMVVDFEQPELLQKIGSSYYIHRAQESGTLAADKVNLKQNYLESSNVNPTEEMIKMLEAFRSFEASQKGIQTIDELTSRIINDQGL